MYMQYTLLVSDGCMSSVFAVDAITMSGTGCVEWGSGGSGADPGFPWGRFTAWVRMRANIGPRLF